MSLATVILAAGQGKRMQSDLPKVLHPLNNRPMVHYVIDAAKEIGSQETILIVGHKRELVIDACKNMDVDFAVQAEQLGTGHAVRQTEAQLKNFDGDVLILSGDVPLLTAKTLKQLVDRHQKDRPLATLLTAEMADPTGYGRVVRNNDGLVTRIVEHKDADEDILKIQEINVGIYIFSAKELFDTLPEVKNDNSQGEYYLPDVVKIYIDRGEKVIPVLIEDAAETHGINNMEQLKNAEQILLSR